MVHTLRPTQGSRKNRKRIARGNSAGGGTTGGRGTKGQASRSGGKVHGNFEGGQMTLLFRQPKLAGFKNPRRIEYEVLNLSTLEKNLEPGKYDVTALREHRVIRTKKPVKILGQGSLTKKFELTVHAASKSAKEAVEKAGGKVEVVGTTRAQ